MRAASVRPLLLLAAGLLLAGAGCARHERAVAAGLRTRTLIVGNGGEPASLDPQIAVALVDMNILTALFEGLTVLDERTAQPVPGVAERWEISPDGLVYTFHLRPGARWSDDTPVTAGDFVYSFHRILSPAFAAPYSYMLWPIKNAEAFNAGKVTDFSAVGVAAVDDRTLRIALERPTPYLLALAAHNTWMPVPRSVVERHGAADDRNSPWARSGRLVGNGPFTLTEWKPDVRVVVTKNPRYWNAALTRLEQVVFLPTDNPDAEERNFRAGQVHVTYGLPVTKIASYREQAPAQLRIDPLLANRYLSFNVKRPPLDNPKVRRALALAIDRAAFCRTALAASRQPAGRFTPPDCAGYTADASQPTDFAAARQLLSEAGFPGGRGLPVLELQFDPRFEQPKIAEAVQETWRRELGVNVTLAQVEAKIRIQNEQTLNYTLSFSGWVADFPDPATFLELFITGGGNNWTGWSQPAYDRLIAEAARTLDPAARFGLFRQAEALLLEEAPVAPLFFDAQIYLIHPAVRGWASAPLGLHLYQHVWLEN